MASRKRSISNDADFSAHHTEWDELSCPICMDHPHNAVLILCSSHEKGCRSFICDTSYRHSNCLDRFKKPVSENKDHDLENTSRSSSSLKCPLCRGSVMGWKVVEEARKYLNSKPRSCSRESCSFSGNYPELRRHARAAHPAARPSDVDPSRERAWRRLEHQREFSDIISVIRSSMPGAVVFGDYAIENGDEGLAGGERGGGGGNGHWWTAFFLFQMIGSMDVPAASDRRGGGSGRSRVPTRARHRLLWGESLLGLQDEEHDDSDNDDDDDPFGLNDNGEDHHAPHNTRRLRRRLSRYSSDEDQ